MGLLEYIEYLNLISYLEYLNRNAHFSYSFTLYRVFWTRCVNVNEDRPIGLISRFQECKIVHKFAGVTHKGKSNCSLVYEISTALNWHQFRRP